MCVFQWNHDHKRATSNTNKPTRTTRTRTTKRTEIKNNNSNKHSLVSQSNACVCVCVFYSLIKETQQTGVGIHFNIFCWWSSIIFPAIWICLNMETKFISSYASECVRVFVVVFLFFLFFLFSWIVVVTFVKFSLNMKLTSSHCSLIYVCTPMYNFCLFFFFFS